MSRNIQKNGDHFWFVDPGRHRNIFCLIGIFSSVSGPDPYHFALKTENSSLKCSEFISHIYEFMFHWLQNWNLLNISMIWDSLFSELKSKNRYNFFLSKCFISEKYIEILHSFGVFWKLIHVQGKKIQIKMYQILTYKILFPIKRSDPDQFFIRIRWYSGMV